MILDGKTANRLSAAGLAVMLVVGLALLALVPGWGFTEPPADEPATIATVVYDEAPAVQSPPTTASPNAEQARRARRVVQQLESELRDLHAEVRAVEERLRVARSRVARLEGRAEPGPTPVPRAGLELPGLPRAATPPPGAVDMVPRFPTPAPAVPAQP